MYTVYTNGNFISLNDDNTIYSIMVVGGKKIAYVGYNTPICYDNAKIVDLKDGYVVPLINDMVFYDFSHAHCKVLAEGEQADFIVLNKNILTEKDPQILAVYKKGKKVV